MICKQSIHEWRSFDGMQRYGTMHFLILEVHSKSTILTRIMMKDRLHLIVPCTWNAGKLLHASTNLDVFVCAVEVFNARLYVWSDWGDIKVEFFLFVEFVQPIWRVMLPRLSVCRLIMMPGPPIQKFSSYSSDKRPNSSLLPRPAWPIVFVRGEKSIRKLDD